jgi:DNA polymerase-1
VIYFIGNYEVENTQSATIQDLRKWLLKQKLYAIDSETVMGEWVNEQIPILYQFGNKYDQWIVDARDISIAPLKSLLESNKSRKLLHNAKFDYKVLKYHSSITLENVWDTMLGDQILNTGLDKPKGFYTLEETHYRYYNTNPYGNQLSLFDPFIPKKIRSQISKKDSEPVTWPEVFYASMDLITTCKVYDKQYYELKKQDLLKTADLENEFVLVLGDMEINGIPLNVNRWMELYEWSSAKMIEQENILKKLYPSVANWNSSLQVKKLFKEIGIPIKMKNKESVSEVVIKEHAKDFPIIDEFLKYKRFQKLSSTYGVAFLSHVNPNTQRVHSSFLQIMSTGRISSTSPNLTNLPAQKPDFSEGIWWREAFESEKSFTIADYSQQELRIAAHISQDPEMMEIFKQNRDPHKETAAALYEIDIDNVTGAQRKVAKTLGFSIIYGASPFKVSKTFGISLKEAKKLIDNYYSRFIKVKEFQEKSYTFALKNGYIITDTLGRRSYLDDWYLIPHLSKIDDPTIKKRLSELQGEIFRKSSNYPIQSQAALIAKTAGILMRQYLKMSPAFSLLVLEHDCWIVENHSPEASKIVEECMRKAAEMYCDVPIPAEASITKKWSK